MKVRLTSVLLITATTLILSAPARADSNCGDVKRDLESRFRIVRFGPCDHLEPATAATIGLAKCAEVVAAGATPSESGHRTVRHQKKLFGIGGGVGVNLYMGYCGGD